MIDIKTALYNILHSRYGRDVRQSIHDGIYQIDANANEALQKAKSIAVGTAVSSTTSSSSGFVSGNLYLNNTTWDIWECAGTNTWINKGNVKGATGSKGLDGLSYYIHIRYSQYYDGTDFTVSPTAASQYMGVYAGQSQTAPTNKADYNWAAFVGAAGTSSYVHIMYSENADGENFVSIPTANCKYIGFYSGSSSSAPANKAYYTWSEYVGKSGAGTGDMLKSEYAGSGVTGTVDKALKADNATNASNLKKIDGTTVTADSITDKLSDAAQLSKDNIFTKSTTYKNSFSNPSENKWGDNYLQFYDSNNNRVAFLNCFYNANGTTDLAINTDNGKVLINGNDVVGEFIGTKAQWNALTSSEKAKYDGKKVNITDDYESNIKQNVADCIASTSEDDVVGVDVIKDLKTYSTAPKIVGKVNLGNGIIRDVYEKTYVCAIDSADVAHSIDSLLTADKYTIWNVRGVFSGVNAQGNINCIVPYVTYNGSWVYFTVSQNEGMGLNYLHNVAGFVGRTLYLTVEYVEKI